MKIVIVGGGASGLMLASLLHDYDSSLDVLILEKDEHVGKKILLSGNGRCNLTNKNIKEIHYNNELTYKVASSFNVEEYFNSLGLLTYHDEEGRVYPISNVSNSVLDTLRKNIEGYTILNNYTVSKIDKVNDKYLINNSIEADIVVLACGGKTLYKEANGYNLASRLDMKISPLHAILSPVKVIENLASIANLRAKVKATLLVDDKEVYSTNGEVLFKNDALSGICIFEISSMMARYPFSHFKVALDMLPSLSEEELSDYINKYNSIEKIFPKMIAMFINKKNKGNLAHTIKNLEFEVFELADFKNAHVTAGGVEYSSLNENLESNKNKNIYVVGELLNGDGTCGGYNFTFAFGSAYLVSKAIIRKLENEK